MASKHYKLLWNILKRRHIDVKAQVNGREEPKPHVLYVRRISERIVGERVGVGSSTAVFHVLVPRKA